MNKLLTVAIAATFGIGGWAATAHYADAREGGRSVGGIGGISSPIRGGGGGGAMGRMGGGGGGGMRMNSQRFNGNIGGGGRMSGQRFSGPRISGNRGRGDGIGNLNRRGKWAGNNGWKGNGKWRGSRGRYRNYAFYGAPFIASGAYGYYNSDCGWLRIRAIETGSSYWWERYNECRYDY